jgi:hypothetical protein
MPGTFTVRSAVNDAIASEVSLDGPLELGRQRAGEPGSYQLLATSNGNSGQEVLTLKGHADSVHKQPSAPTARGS